MYYLISNVFKENSKLFYKNSLFENILLIYSTSKISCDVPKSTYFENLVSKCTFIPLKLKNSWLCLRFLFVL